MAVLATAQKTIIDLTDSDIYVGAINLISGSAEYILEADGDNSYWVAADGLEPSNEYTLSVRELALVEGTAVGVTQELVNLDTETVHDRGTLDFTYGKQVRYLTTPDVDGNYALYLYAGISGATIGNTIQFIKVQLEEGSCATTWALSPEDSEKTVSTLQTDLETLDGDVVNRIEDYIDKLKLPEKYASLEEFIKLTGKVSATESSLVQHSDKFDSAFERIEVTENGVKEIKSHVEWGIDEDGTPYLDLKTTESKIRMRLTNTKLAFLQGNSDELAYLSDNKLYVTRMEVINQIAFGSEEDGYMDITPTPTGVAFRWRS